MEPLRTERIIWTDQLRQELFSSILRVTNTVKWRKLKKLKITAQTWNEIVKNFPQSINAEKARIYWDTWMKTMLFSKETLHYSSMKLSILEFLLTMKPKKWSDINWVTVSKKLFPRISNKFVGTLFHSWVKYNVPEEQKCDINKVLNYLTKNCKEDLMEKIQTGRDKPVPKLSVRGKDKLINLNKEKDD
ncbi:uncharacterized protein LOC126903133 [Daktulosphaira vitifoliae]|uniref:uncharacterized protein LOC126903133 n=1 Tax=Daktulosphaira vitifoliae TaxID=58002 RepID=UPI0021A9D3D0|nr:uncharacterized protein LOC126903133 [Daktulosphaira vitifoliae]